MILYSSNHGLVQLRGCGCVSTRLLQSYQAMGCINNPTTRRKLDHQQILADSSSTEFVKNNHKISIQQRLPPHKCESQPDIFPLPHQDQPSHQLQIEPVPQQHPPEPSPAPQQKEIIASCPPVQDQAEQQEQSFQSVKQYFAGLCTQGGTEAEVFQKLGRKRIQIPIT